MAAAEGAGYTAFRFRRPFADLGGRRSDPTTVSGSRYAPETLAEIDTEEFTPALQRE